MCLCYVCACACVLNAVVCGALEHMLPLAVIGGDLKCALLVDTTSQKVDVRKHECVCRGACQSVCE